MPRRHGFLHMIKIIEKSFGTKYRAAVISDTHGSYSLLRRLLERDEVKSAGHTVFNGDHISRGRESLACLRFLMDLEGRENVTVIKGNLERLVNWYITAEPEGILRHFRGHSYNLFRECMEEQNAGPINEKTFPSLRKLFMEKYPDIIKYCAGLPNALETEDLVFTHAGLGAHENWRDSTEQEVMKNDPFIHVGVNTTGKWLVCGHMPTWNSKHSGNSNNCYVDEGRKMVFTDGGNQVKDFAQLNALIINGDCGSLSFNTVFESWYPVFFASKKWEADADYGCEKDHWPEGELEIVSRGEDFTLCRREDGSLMYLNNGHASFVGNTACILRNTVSSMLSVEAGERLELLDAPGGRYILVRKENGLIGWVDGGVLL